MEIIHKNLSKEPLFEALALPENILVFSHLRWDFVYQRPQHLLTRFAKDFNVTFIEEPVFDAADKPYYTFAEREEQIIVMTPHLAAGLSPEEVRDALKILFNEHMENKVLANYAFWYYTPMVLEFTAKYNPKLVIYDCMDELSAFKFAPARIRVLEQELLKLSDVVFTGGRSLYEAKKHQHANIFPFPSSIDKKHFKKVREIAFNRTKEKGRKVKLGFYGVIDERFDIELISKIAEKRPEWELILIGPVVKIDEHVLPRQANVKYLGSKNYQELPHFMSYWDIALIPFLLNDSTRFISPTKTPEYLAAGLPVISTPIADVVNPYGINKLVHIGKNADEFVEAAEEYLLLSSQQKSVWLKRVDSFLELNSWDKTQSSMLVKIKDVLNQKSETQLAKII